MSDLIKIKQEIDEILETINKIENRIPSQIIEVMDIVNSSFVKSINFACKGMVVVQIAMICDSMLNLSLLLDGVVMTNSTKKVQVLKLNCTEKRSHCIMIVGRGTNVEGCYIKLDAPKIKKIGEAI